MEEEQQASGSLIKYSTLQFLNFLTFSLGIAILIITFIIWAKVKSFNTFILTLLLVSFFIICITFVGCKIRYSPTTLIIYFMLVFFILVGVIILVFYIIYDKEQIITFLVYNMMDSRPAIEEARKYLDQNIDIIKILLLTYTFIIV